MLDAVPLSSGVGDKDAKLVPAGPGQTLAECLKPGQELKASYDADPISRVIGSASYEAFSSCPGFRHSASGWPGPAGTSFASLSPTPDESGTASSMERV